MYRVLEQDGATRERRDQLTRPASQKPERLATAPNQLWSWDITKLRGMEEPRSAWMVSWSGRMICFWQVSSISLLACPAPSRGAAIQPTT
jgi:hypothetical protein